jgi:hypothetical protein
MTDRRNKILFRGLAQNDLSKVPKVPQLADSEGIQANPLAAARSWHPLSFVQSLQLAFHWFCSSGNG